MAESSVMKRLVRAQNPRPVEEADHVRALRKQINLAGDAVLGIRLGLRGMAEHERPPSKLRELLMDDGLIQSYEFDGQIGAVWIFDRTMVATCVEAQTLGHLNPQIAPREVITPLDAALSNALAEALIPSLDTSPTPATEAGAVFETCDEMLLSFETPKLKLMDLEFDVERGTRRGRIQVVMPVTSHLGVVLDPQDVDEARMARVLGAAEADLEVELYRANLSYETLKSLEIGSTVPVPRLAVQEMRMIASNGKTIAFGKLGMASGARAIKLTTDPNAQGASAPLGVGGGQTAKKAPATAAKAPKPLSPAAAPPPATDAAAGLPPLPGAGDAGSALPPLPGAEEAGGLPPLPGGDGGGLPDLPAMQPLGGDGGGLPPLGGGDEAGGLPPLSPMPMDLPS